MPRPPDPYDYEDDIAPPPQQGTNRLGGALSRRPRRPPPPARRPPPAAPGVAYPANRTFAAGAVEAGDEQANEDAEGPAQRVRSRRAGTPRSAARPEYGPPAAERAPRSQAASARPGRVADRAVPSRQQRRSPSGRAAVSRNPLPYAIAAFTGVVLLGLLALVVLTGQSRTNTPAAQGGAPPAPPAGNNTAPTNPPAAAGSDPPRIPLVEFKKLYDDPARRPLIIDVRDPSTYAAGHIVGAVNIPEAEVDTRFKEIPKDKLVIAYCQ